MNQDTTFISNRESESLEWIQIDNKHNKAKQEKS